MQHPLVVLALSTHLKTDNETKAERIEVASRLLLVNKSSTVTLMIKTGCRGPETREKPRNVTGREGGV